MARVNLTLSAIKPIGIILFLGFGAKIPSVSRVIGNTLGAAFLWCGDICIRCEECGALGDSERSDGGFY